MDKVYNCDNQDIEQSDAVIRGNNCVVRGDRNYVDGHKCTVYGNDNIIRSNSCTVFGNDNIIRSNDCIVNGYDNKVCASHTRDATNDEEESTKRLLELQKLRMNIRKLELLHKELFGETKNEW